MERYDQGEGGGEDIPPGPALGIGVSSLMKRDVAGPVPLRMSTARIVEGIVVCVRRVNGNRIVVD